MGDFPGPSSARRPVVAIPARFSQSASALRYQAEVGARGLIEAVYAAGGEPVLVHPHAPGGAVEDDEVAERLQLADAVLLPGGGDLAAHWSGQQPHPSLYDVDVEQDAFDLAVVRVALAAGVPLLAVCRGMQVLNVARGGTLFADMTELGGYASDHRHRVHSVDVEEGSVLADAAGTLLEISCYHHQCVAAAGSGLRPIAFSEDGVPEALVLDGAPGWVLGVQWHPEDTAARQPAQLAIFAAHVQAAQERLSVLR